MKNFYFDLDDAGIILRELYQASKRMMNPLNINGISSLMDSEMQSSMLASHKRNARNPQPFTVPTNKYHSKQVLRATMHKNDSLRFDINNSNNRTKGFGDRLSADKPNKTKK